MFDRIKCGDHQLMSFRVLFKAHIMMFNKLTSVFSKLIEQCLKTWDDVCGQNAAHKSLITNQFSGWRGDALDSKKQFNSINAILFRNHHFGGLKRNCLVVSENNEVPFRVSVKFWQSQKKAWASKSGVRQLLLVKNNNRLAFFWRFKTASNTGNCWSNAYFNRLFELKIVFIKYLHYKLWRKSAIMHMDSFMLHSYL